MSCTTHTPGPWHATRLRQALGFHDIGAANGANVAHVLHDDNDRGPAETRANARLIAAAPTMHAALRTLADRKTLDRYEDSEIRTMVAELAADALTNTEAA